MRRNDREHLSLYDVTTAQHLCVRPLRITAITSRLPGKSSYTRCSESLRVNQACWISTLAYSLPSAKSFASRTVAIVIGGPRLPCDHSGQTYFSVLGQAPLLHRSRQACSSPKARVGERQADTFVFRASLSCTDQQISGYTMQRDRRALTVQSIKDPFHFPSSVSRV